MLKQSCGELVTLKGIINRVKKNVQRQAEYYEIEFIYDDVAMVLIGFHPTLLNLEKSFYIISGIQIGLIENKFCGILSPSAKIHKVLSVNINAPEILQDAFIIHLSQFFSKQELTKVGFLLPLLNQRLKDIKLHPTLQAKIAQVTFDGQQNIINLVVVEQQKLSLLDVELKLTNEQPNLRDNFQVGNLVSLTNISKQGRVLSNSYKGFLQDQKILGHSCQAYAEDKRFNDAFMDERTLRPLKGYLEFYSQLEEIQEMPYSDFRCVRPQTLDRQVRKFKVDALKTCFSSAQYKCGNCAGAIGIVLQDYYTCKGCGRYYSDRETDAQWEFMALIMVKNEQTQALLRLKNDLVCQFFDVTSQELRKLQLYCLDLGVRLVLRKEMQLENDFLGQLYMKLYKQGVSKIVWAHPYCDLLKTSRIKEKWSALRKATMKEVQIELNYFDFFAPSDYERMLVNPNGTFEIKDTADGKKKELVLKVISQDPLLCLECVCIREVKIQEYAQLLLNQLG